MTVTTTYAAQAMLNPKHTGDLYVAQVILQYWQRATRRQWGRGFMRGSETYTWGPIDTRRESSAGM